METATVPVNFFQCSGSLADDVLTYVKRKADDEIYKQLKNNFFCFILASRQMGKSSLRVRTMKRMQNEGYICAAVDLTSFGGANSSEQTWYFSFLHKMTAQLGLNFDLKKWWYANSGLTAVSRMYLFFETIVLQEIKENVIIFIDEIDSLLSIDPKIFNRDDFFAAIRSFYNQRPDNPELQRLNFTIIGATMPTELISDPLKTPFNIGVSINLENFSLENAMNLTIGFEHITTNKTTLLQEILFWTGGQPSLTQKLCKSISETETDIMSVKPVVRKHVDELFFNPTATADDMNIAHVSDRILYNKEYGHKMLEIYHKVYRQEKIKIDKADKIHLYLLLSGLVIDRNGLFAIGNRIYTRKFDEKWIETAISKFHRPYSRDLDRWYKMDKSISAALSGDVLEKALIWQSSRNDLTDLEREYFDFSRKVENAKKDMEAARKQNEHLLSIEILKRKDAEKSKRQFRIMMVTSILVALGVVVFTIYAMVWKNREKEITNNKLHILEAYKYISNAMQAEPKNPTEALLMADSAVMFFSNQDILSKMHAIYANNYFYTNIPANPSLFKSVAVSPDGNLLLYVTEQKKIFLRDLKENRLIKGFYDKLDKGNIARHSVSCFSNSGKYCLFSVNKMLYISDAQGEIILSAQNDSTIVAATFTPDEKEVLTCTSTGFVKSWDLSGNQKVLKSFGKPINAVAFSKDANSVCLVIENNQVVLFDLLAKTEKLLLNSTEPVSWIQLSPDGQQALIICRGNYAKLIDQNGSELSLLVGHRSIINKAYFTPSGNSILTISKDKTFRIWNLAGQEIGQLKGHTDFGIDAAFSAHNNYVFTSSFDRTIKRWNLRDVEQVWGFPAGNGVRGAVFSASGNKLAILDKNNWITIIDTKTQSEIAKMQLSGSPTCGAFSPNEKIFVAGTVKNQIVKLSLNSKDTMCFDAHSATILAVCVTDEGRIFSGSRDQMLCVWSAQGRLENSFSNKQPCSVLALSPDGERIAVGYKTGIVEIRQINGLSNRSFKLKASNFTSLQFGADGKSLLCSTDDAKIIKWRSDVDSVLVFQDMGTKALCVFQGDKPNTIVSGHIDGSICQWTDDGLLLRVFRDFYSPVHSVVFANAHFFAFSGDYKLSKLNPSLPIDSFLSVLKDHSPKRKNLAINK
jgi:WD40 repeat protein